MLMQKRGLNQVLLTLCVTRCRAGTIRGRTPTQNSALVALLLRLLSVWRSASRSWLGTSLLSGKMYLFVM